MIEYDYLKNAIGYYRDIFGDCDFAYQIYDWRSGGAIKNMEIFPQYDLRLKTLPTDEDMLVDILSDYFPRKYDFDTNGFKFRVNKDTGNIIVSDIDWDLRVETLCEDDRVYEDINKYSGKLPKRMKINLKDLGFDTIPNMETLEIRVDNYLYDKYKFCHNGFDLALNEETGNVIITDIRWDIVLA